MKQARKFVVFCFCALALAACVVAPRKEIASADGKADAESPDWKQAWDTESLQCVRKADTEAAEAYIACLEHQLQTEQQIASRSAGSPAAPAPSATEQSPPPPAPTASATAPAPVAAQLPASQPPAAAAPQPSAAPPPPPPAPTASAAPPPPPLQQMPMRGGRVVWVPVATGPYCSVQQSITLEVVNRTDHLVEVSGGKVVPLNCEQERFVQARVLRRNGVMENTWVIPPHATARLVFLPLNGGLGMEVPVRYEAYLNLGPGAPAPVVGIMDRDYQVPSPSGGKWSQEVSYGYLGNPE